MDSSPAVDPHLRGVLANMDVAKRKAEEAKVQAERATSDLRFWADLEEFLRRKWPLHVLQLLEKTGTRDTAVPVDLDTIRSEAREQADVQRRRFPGIIEQESNLLELPLDRDTSRHPKYTFQRGFFQLAIVEAKGLARLSDNEGRLSELPADVGAVLLAVKRENDRVFGRSFAGKAVLKRIYECYSFILKKEGLPPGKSIPIRKITARFGKNIKGFRTDEFLVDLSRIVEQGPTEISGHVLDLQQTKDTNQGMLLHGSAGRGYVGFISFRKAAT